MKIQAPAETRPRTLALVAVACKGNSLFVGWLLNVPATCYSVSQGRICSDNFTCCHTEIEVADQTQSQYTDTGPTSPSADPITPGAWQSSHWSANFEVTGMTRPRKAGSSALEADALPLGQRGGLRETDMLTITPRPSAITHKDTDRMPHAEVSHSLDFPSIESEVMKVN